MNFSTHSLDDNKDPMTISVTENAADANTVGFDASDILEGILILSDIAGVAIVGLVIVTVYYQRDWGKFLLRNRWIWRHKKTASKVYPICHSIIFLNPL